MLVSDESESRPIELICRSLRLPLVVCPALLSVAGICQRPSLAIPAGTPISVYLDRHLPMKVGQPIRAGLVYPVFEGETLVLPARSVLQGSIVSLKPDKLARLHARLRGDLTPYRVPVVQFSAIELVDGTSLPVSVGEVSIGAPIVRIVPPPPRNGGFLRRAADTAMQAIRDQIHVFTGPDKADRLLQTLYSNLPYHPQRVETATAWSFETAQTVYLAVGQVPMLLPDVEKAKEKPEGMAVARSDPSVWTIDAYLTSALDSKSTPVGQTIHAIVARPVFNEDRSVVVPVGSTLTGTIVRSKPARSFGRGGTLRFAFTQLTLPNAQPQSVRTTVTSVDSQGAMALALDSEGQAKPQSNKNVVVPLVLALLATRALHNDENGGPQVGRNAAGANGFGLLGVIAGAAAGSPGVAAGIGYYGAALTVYDRFLTHGKEVVFAKDTRIVVQTSSRRSAAIRANTVATPK